VTAVSVGDGGTGPGTAGRLTLGGRRRFAEPGPAHAERAPGRFVSDLVSFSAIKQFGTSVQPEFREVAESDVGDVYLRR
jgi:hypothetical protein